MSARARVSVGRWLAVAPAFALLLAPLEARALRVVVENLVVVSDPFVATDYHLDVYVELEPGDETLPDLLSWQGAVDLSGPASGVEFLSPFAVRTTGPEHPPLLVSNFLADFGADNGPARASATAFLLSGGVPIFDGGGLFRVPLRVAAGSSGTVGVVLDEDPFSGVFLVADDFSEIPYTAVDGSITVVAPEPVPGPGPAARLGLAMLIGGSAPYVASRSRAARSKRKSRRQGALAPV